MGIFKKKNRDKYEDKLNYPWEKYYSKECRCIDVPNCSIYKFLEVSSYSHINSLAINYFGNSFTYRELLEKIDVCSRAFRCHGVRCGDVVTICMPNTPEAVVCFYALNKIGAIANIIHPLSSEEEIKHSIKSTKSVLLIAINLSYEKIKDIVFDSNIYRVVIVSAKESMPSIVGLGYFLSQEIKINVDYSNELFISWSDFYNKGLNYDASVYIETDRDTDCLMLHSGGTTGIPKNIVLTNGCINAIMEQAKICFPDIGVDDSILAILPIFHCFGLVVCICVPLVLGAIVNLIPQFDAKRFDKLIRRYKPTLLVGVPTLYEALVNNPYMMNVDLSNLKYVVSGGDTLSSEKNDEVNMFLKKHGASVNICQGYGLTEVCGPVCFGCLGSDKLGSCGIPLPGNVVKIFDIDTMEEKRSGEIGEICISGPTVMARYLDNEEETNKMVLTHPDGIRYVHTGDLGYMDSDGVLFFVQRLKRMLIVSGYNVYPSYIEDVIMKHPKVELCGVIGIPHPYKIQVSKAYIVLKQKEEINDDVLKEIKSYCEKNLSKYMIPKEFVFRDSLPKTLIGKINYRELEKHN